MDTDAVLERERVALAEDLVHRDEEIRRLAVERLLALPAAEAVPLLVEALGDASWRVRKAAVARLVACAETGAVVEALTGALADGENPGRRNSAVEALMAMGSPVVGLLLPALASDDHDVRKLVVDVMAGIGDPVTRGPLLGALSDPDSNVRAAVADALGVIGGEEACEALRAQAIREDEDTLVRFSALRALARLSSPVPVGQLGGVLADPVLRPAGLALLGYGRDANGESVLSKALLDRSRASREAAMEALLCLLSREDGAAAEALAGRIRDASRASEGSIAAAVERLGEADLSSRLMLVQFLGLCGAPESVLPILEAGRDEAMSEVAHETLVAFGTRASSVLLESWESLGADLRIAACAVLARTGGAEVESRLITVLGDPDVELRAAAAEALGQRRAGSALGDLAARIEAAAQDEDHESEQEIDALVTALIGLAGAADRPARTSAPRDDLGESVAALLFDRIAGAADPARQAMARVLARVARPEDAEAMMSLLKDPSAVVRRLAIEGLAGSGSEPVAEQLRLALGDESPTVRMAAAAALGESTGDAVLADLERALRDEDPRVAASAARAIGRHGEARSLRAEAVSLLAAALAGEGLVGMAALEALEHVGGQEAATAASAVLGRSEPELLQAAVRCIGRHGDAASLAALIPIVQHESWAVRSLAIETLAERRVARALPAILRRLEREQDGFVRDAITRALRVLEESATR